jgi:hypothetical protein
MATNLNINKSLLEAALRVSGMKTKRATISAALAELIQRRKQCRVLEVFGQLDYDPDYDYKSGRGLSQGIASEEPLAPDGDQWWKSMNDEEVEDWVEGR